MAASSSEGSGCLTAFLSFFRRKENAIQGPLPYRLRDDFLSPTEFSFYKVLTSVVGSNLIALTKVRLADIFFVSQPNENISYLNRIAQRHVDFLLCAPSTMKPVVGMELDDSSHNKSSKQERDEFLDSVFQSAKLPLLRVPAKREYNTQEIAVLLADYLDVKPDGSSAPMVNEKIAESVPVCPKCGIPMILRTATKGNRQGEQFFGCQNYPHCREVIPVAKKTEI